MNWIMTMTITALTFFTVQAFAESNLYEQRSSMDGQVSEWAAQNIRKSGPFASEVPAAHIILNSIQKNRYIALKKTLNLMPYIAVR